MLYSSLYSSPIGKLTLASDGDSLTGLWMENQKYFGSTIKGEIVEKDELELFVTWPRFSWTHIYDNLCVKGD